MRAREQDIQSVFSLAMYTKWLFNSTKQVLFEEIITSRDPPHFKEPENSSSYRQKPDTVPCPQEIDYSLR